MFFYEGHSCPYCQKPFTEEDDIVSCPVCGAPHHRHCWKNHGACAHEADHNTDKQWTRDKAARSTTESAPTRHPCPNCGADNSPYAEICGHCGRPLTAQEWSSSSKSQNTYRAAPPPPGGYYQYAPYQAQQPNFYADMSPKDTIAGETVEDIATAVHSNTRYYLPRFRKMNAGGSKIAWNWMAFLIPSYWLLYRKQYLAGCIMLLLELVANTLLIALVTVHADTLMLAGTENPYMLAEVLTQQPYLMGLLASVYLFIISIRVIAALFGNYWYMKHTMKTIARTRDMYPEGYSAQLSAVGGTSFVLAIVAYMCMSMLPTMVSMFFMGV